MMKLAYSTVACPDWTLQRVAESLDDLEFDGVELRTFGDGSRKFACDPALTAPAKIRSLFSADGVEICGLGSSARFDQPLFPPPPIGFVLDDDERSVREAKPIVNLAQAVGAPVVRVFGFEGCAVESRKSFRKRVVRRLRKLVDHARNTHVTIALENAGWFSRTEELMAVIEEVGSPILGVSYSLASAAGAGENPAESIRAIGRNLVQARIKDLKKGRPARLGSGDLDCTGFVDALRDAGFDGWLVYEWDAAWVPDLESAEDVLPHAAATLCDWSTTAGKKERVAVATA